MTDLPDVNDRGGKRSGALIAALVFSLFAGPTLGFVVGRGSSSDEPRVRATAEADDGDRVAVGSTGAPPVIAGPGGAVAPSFALDRAAVSIIPDVGYPAAEPMQRLFVRDAGSTRIRTYRAATQAYDDGVPWWDPPGHCFPSGWVQTDVSTENAVGIATASTYTELREETVNAQLSVMGIAEGEPSWIAVAQVPAGAATVRAAFPGGGADEMEPVEGIAVLVAPAPDGSGYEELWQASVKVEAVDPSGNVIGRGASGDYMQGEPLVECVAPPEPLPEPGAEQPADPEAARAAVSEAFAIIYDSSRSDEERNAVIDDSRGLAEVRDRLANGPFAQQVNDARAEAKDIVFTSATRAAVRYDIIIKDYTNFTGRLGEAVLIDGVWKVTRDTICNDITLATETCPPVD